MVIHTGRVNGNGLMAICMKVTLRMATRMAKVPSSARRVAGHTLVSGSKAK